MLRCYHKHMIEENNEDNQSLKPGHDGDRFGKKASPKKLPKPRKLGLPGRKAKIEFDDVARALEQARTVKGAAEILGISPSYLSVYLSKKNRKPWYLALRKAWRIESQRERARRYYWRTKHGCEPPPLRYQ